jgi:hypothetical protein
VDGRRTFEPTSTLIPTQYTLNSQPHTPYPILHTSYPKPHTLNQVSGAAGWDDLLGALQRQAEEEEGKGAKGGEMGGEDAGVARSVEASKGEVEVELVLFKSGRKKALLGKGKS